MIDLKEKFIRYNATPNDTNKGNCTIRAMCLAYDKPYKEIRSDLYTLNGGYQHYNNLINILKYIRIKGYNSTETYKEKCTLAEFEETHSTGIYLILCGENVGQTSHLVCIYNGDLYDSWDSSEYVVTYVFEIQSQTDKQILDFNSIQDKLIEYIEKSIKICCDKYVKKFNLEMEIWDIDIVSLKTKNEYELQYRVYRYDTNKYIDILYKFTPTMTEDTAIDEVANTTKKLIKKLFEQELKNQTIQNTLKKSQDKDLLQSIISGDIVIYRGSRGQIPYGLYDQKLAINNTPDNTWIDDYKYKKSTGLVGVYLKDKKQYYAETPDSKYDIYGYIQLEFTNDKILLRPIIIDGQLFIPVGQETGKYNYYPKGIYRTNEPIGNDVVDNIKQIQSNWFNNFMKGLNI